MTDPAALAIPRRAAAAEAPEVAPQEHAAAPLLSPAATTLAATALLFLYVAPMWLLAVEMWRTSVERNSPFFPWIGALASNSGSALTEVHQLLLPLVSGLSVVALKSGGRAVRFLAGFVLLNFVLAIGIDVSLQIDTVKAGLEGFGVDAATLAALLRRIRETLLLYYAILVGVRLGIQKP